MPDKLKPRTKAWRERQDRWKHNSFFGHVAMAGANMKAIIVSTTATNEAKAIAAFVVYDLERLRLALKQRKMPV